MSDMEHLINFIQQTAECRTPVVITLEDLPDGLSPTELVGLLADMAEMPLKVFDIHHMDDRSASRHILEAIRTGSWLLFNVSPFQGVEGLLRDLGRRLFTIMPNDVTRPLMGRFRLLMSLRRATPKSAVFKKLAMPLPIHPNMTIREADDQEYVPKGPLWPTSVADCQLGALFYRATEINGTERLAPLPEKRNTRPATSTSRPATSTSRPATSTSRPATSTSRPATSTSRPATASATAPTHPPTVTATSESYQQIQADVERDYFERHASQVSQEVFGYLMRGYYTTGDTHGLRMARGIREVIGSANGMSKAQAPEPAPDSHRMRIAAAEDEEGGLVFEGPPDSFGMRPANWRSLKVWAVPLHPSASPVPVGWPQHPSLHCPVCVAKTNLLYTCIAYRAADVLEGVRPVLRALLSLATGILALRDAGLAHQYLCLDSLVQLGSADAPSDAFKLLVTNQIAMYSPNEEGLMVAKCGPTPTMYLSPRAVRSGEHTFSDDAWSLGVILWQLLALQYQGDFLPYESEQQPAREIISSESFDPMRYFKLPMGVPDEIMFVWESIGCRCLCLDPSKRMTLAQVINRLPK